MIRIEGTFVCSCETVVVEDDAVLVLGIRGRARYAQAHVPKRGSSHRVPRVPQGWLLRHEELVGLLGSLTRALLEFFKASFFSLLCLIFPSLVSANTPSLKANPPLCIS